MKKFLVIFLFFSIMAVPEMDQGNHLGNSRTFIRPLDFRIKGIKLAVQAIVRDCEQQWREFETTLTTLMFTDTELVQDYYAQPHPMIRSIYDTFSNKIDGVLMSVPDFIPDAPAHLQESVMSRIKGQRLALKGLMGLE